MSSDRLEADASGASRITLAGHAGRASIHAGGASHVSAAALDSEELVADVRGASSAELRASRSADVSVQHASAVHVTGTPARVARRLDAGSRLTVDEGIAIRTRLIRNRDMRASATRGNP